MIKLSILILIFGALCIQLSKQQTSEGVEGEVESEVEGKIEGDGEGKSESGVESNENVDEYFVDARQLTEELDQMEGEFSGRADDSGKKSKFLPPEVLEYKSTVENLKCGELFVIKEEKYLTFKMNSPEEVCKYEFVGTKTDNCTVAFMCKGKVHFKPPDKEKGCTEDFIKISDGTDGRMAGCGRFIFDDKPRIARNRGSDIYFTFKGKADDAICVVFCKQDAKSDSPKMKKLRTISKIKNYKGRKTERSCVCGKKDVPQGRIVGGDTAEKFEFPWISPILQKSGKASRISFCAASLINDQYAITAGHCFAYGQKPEQVQLLFHAHLLDQRVGKGQQPSNKMFQQIPGWNDPKATDESEGSLRVDVESILVHPKFVLRTFEYDIALLKLKKKVNLKTDKVTPICLPEVSDDFNYTGKYLTVAGWGRYSEKLMAGVRLLQKLDVPYHSLQECRKYNKARSRHICAGFLKGGKDSCAGDSGGPLTYKKDPMKNQHVLAGIVSAGRGCARAKALGLYTNVEELVQWVYHHTESATWCKTS